MKTGACKAAVIAIFVTACGGEGVETPELEVESSEQAIINGSLVNPEGNPYVSIHHGGPGNTSTTLPYNICSGTLIRNDAVLTARHCVTYQRSISGTIDTNLEDFELIIGSKRSAVREIVDLGAGVNRDVALIISDRFFQIGDKNVGWFMPVYSAQSNTLIGHELWCFGYGLSDPNDLSTADVLRYAFLKPALVTAEHIQYNVNPLGQMLWKGDSGGSCIYSPPYPYPLYATGVSSTCAGPSGPCQQVKPELFHVALTAELGKRGAGFVHKATSSNSIGNYTTINHTSTDDQPYAIVSVTPNWNPSTLNGVYNNHDIGVFFSGARWHIFNQDLTKIPTGAAFNVSVGDGFVHRVSSANTSGHVTMLDDPRLNGNPNAAFVITPNWNPPGSYGVYNDHPTGVYYTGSRWAIFNQDFAWMPMGAAFNVRIDRSFSVRATFSTVFGNTLYLDDPNLNGHPEAQVFVTPNWNPGGVGNRYLNSAIGVWYDVYRKQWGVFRQDYGQMYADAAFNVLYRP